MGLEALESPASKAEHELCGVGGLNIDVVGLEDRPTPLLWG